MNGENSGSTKSTKTITLVVAVVVIIIVALFIFISPSSPTPNSEMNNLPGETASSSTDTTGGPTGGAFKEVKDAGAIYEIQMNNGSLSPVDTTVKKGEVARLAFSAIDADYSVSFAAPIEMNLSLKKGQAALVPFDAQKNTSGEFAFTIKSAGKTASGNIIVK